MICFHRWGKWSITETALYVRKWIGMEPVKHPVGLRVIQRRQCDKCGKMQINFRNVY